MSKGRTGTFIALLNATIFMTKQVNELKQEGKEANIGNIMISPFSIVRKLRRERKGVV